MTKLVLVIGTFAAIVPLASGHSYGPPPRVTGAPGDNQRACTLCHTGNAPNAGTGSVTILLPSGQVYIPGVKQRLAVHVADPTQRRWGFELTARLDSDPEKADAGSLLSVDNLTQVICEDNAPRPCASGPTFITHTSAGTRNGTPNGATFEFDWIPPATSAGTVTLYVAGNAANGNGSPTGDMIYTSSVQLKPAIPAAPTVSAGNVVSSATGAAGPLAPNSWVTIYGSNLGVTTRPWAAGDFVDGQIPFSLDGVSVLLNQFGAPRLAYVGFVSPTQVNFLMPSDLTVTTTTVQVRNPAGMSTAVPITVQANAPQLFTSDGKSTLATHASGALIGKSGTGTPAAPGEIISIYGTGMGPTTPALIPGQLPTDSFGMTTVPAVTIGGAAATVMSAGVVPGTAGLYQVNVRVPSDAANGDLPLVLQIGTGPSVTTSIPVQK